MQNPCQKFVFIFYLIYKINLIENRVYKFNIVLTAIYNLMGSVTIMRFSGVFSQLIEALPL